jgi:hypothetical protein
MGSDHAMKTQPAANQPRGSLKRRLATTAVVLLLAVGLFLASAFAGILLPPLNTPVHAINPPSASIAQVSSSKGVNGTLASFAALFPQMAPVFLPMVSR